MIGRGEVSGSHWVGVRNRYLERLKLELDEQSFVFSQLTRCRSSFHVSYRTISGTGLLRTNLPS